MKIITFTKNTNKLTNIRDINYETRNRRKYAKYDTPDVNNIRRFFHQNTWRNSEGPPGKFLSSKPVPQNPKNIIYSVILRTTVKVRKLEQRFARVSLEHSRVSARRGYNSVVAASIIPGEEFRCDLYTPFHKWVQFTGNELAIRLSHVASRKDD